ncbi:MAG TPA: hypothetical protein PKI05_17075, partial [Thermogutta sp.]|nr:hypothetical protein [Thermogutta sp.]
KGELIQHVCRFSSLRDLGIHSDLTSDIRPKSGTSAIPCRDVRKRDNKFLREKNGRKEVSLDRAPVVC